MVDQLVIPIGLDIKDLMQQLSDRAVQLLDDPDEAVREHAIQLCGEIGTPTCLEALITQLPQVSGGDLLVICNALGRSKSVVGPILMTYLHTTDPKMRDAYLQALSYVACEEILPRIVALYERWVKPASEYDSKPPNEFNRLALVEAIMKISSMYQETVVEIAVALLRMTEDESVGVRAAAVQGLTARIHELSTPKLRDPRA